MAKGKTARLRIYCICGQKMKVSPSMYGRPGKCVACRQKIRIPTANEIPPDTKELFLREHPEFLRKASVSPDPGGDAAFDSDADSLPLGKEDRQEAPTALEILEPLRVLCSLEAKVERQRRALKDSGSAEELSSRKAELDGQRARIRRARSELDETLRQNLMEVAIELANVQQRIAEMNLNARVGEMDFSAYREEVDSARRRRDHLERRQHDLRGWVATRDVTTAGGFVDVSLDHIPERPELRLPRVVDAGQSLLEEHIAALRDALERRERAERKRSEAERLTPAEGESPKRLKALRLECQAEVRRAQSAVSFYSQRIGRLRDDYEADLQALESQLDIARGRLQVGEIDRKQFDEVERRLLRAKADLVKAVVLARRVLSVPSAADLPVPRGTFLKRLAPPPSVVSADSYVAGAGALVLAASVLLPALQGRSLVSAFLALPAFGLLGLLALIVLAACGAAVLAVVPNCKARGLGLGIVAIVAVVVLPLAFAALPDSLSTTLGRDARLPALALYAWLLGGLLLFVASGMALWRFDSLRFVAPIAAVLAILAAGALTLRTDTPPSVARAEPAASAGAGASVETPRPPATPVASAAPAASSPAEPAAVTTPPQPGGLPETLPPGALRPGDPLPEETVPVEPAPEPDTVPAAEPEAPAEETDPLGFRSIQAELRAVFSAANRQPQFTVAVYVPGQRPYERMFRLGDPVYGSWQLAEFNPITKAVTVSNGSRLIILPRGQRVTLEQAP